MRAVWPFGAHVRDELSAYLDGELEPAGRQAVDDHLAGCAECRAELDGLRQTRDLLRAVRPVAPPRSFAITAEMAAAARPVPLTLPPRQSGTFRALRNATGAAAAMFVALMMVNLIGYSTPVLAPPAETLARTSAAEPARSAA
ncbi:MAG TPA: zf-HC2 domain-containing protein, partial [Chloroflexota bacterium]